MSISVYALAALAAAQTAAPHAAVQPPAPVATIAPAAPQAVILSPPTESVLRAGAEVALVMGEGISSNDKALRAGKQIRLTVASPVMLGGAVVIPTGAPATAEVTDVRRKGMWGKSGGISARVLNVRVGDRLIRLNGTFDDRGVTGTAGVVGAVLLLPVAGFFMTGTSASIPAGSGVKAFLDEDLRLAVPQAAPAAAPVEAAAAPVQTAVQPAAQ